MRCQLTLILYVLLLPQCLLSQKKGAAINDLSVTLHEETVNKVLMALGDISGTSEFEVVLAKGTYTWTVRNPKINIRPDSSFFTCDAIVKTNFFEYKSNVVGNVKIHYDRQHNKILIRITRAIFELYTYIFSNKVHIKNIHLEERFKEPFSFEGPQAISTTLDFVMPDSSVKKIFITPTDCSMDIRWKEICTSCEIKTSTVQPLPTIMKPGEVVSPDQKEKGEGMK